MAKHYFVDQLAYERPEPGHKLCAQFEAVTLQQRGRDNFAVRYGKEIHGGLTYAEACMALGKAMMHQLACAGDLDNREKARAENNV